MTEDQILDVLNDQGVDFILASDTQEIRSGGVKMLAMHIFTSDCDANLIELNFALRELGGKREADDFSLHDIPNDVQWLRDAPAHIIRCPTFTLNVAFVFPGIVDPYEEVKKRAELVVKPNGEMLYRMSKEDKMSFVRAFVRGHDRN